MKRTIDLLPAVIALEVGELDRYPHGVDLAAELQVGKPPHRELVGRQPFVFEPVAQLALELLEPALPASQVERSERGVGDHLDPLRVAGGNPERREHGRHCRDDHLATTELAGVRIRVQPGGATVGEHGEPRGIVTALNGHAPDQVRHLRVRDIDHRRGDVLKRCAQRGGEQL